MNLCSDIMTSEIVPTKRARCGVFENRQADIFVNVFEQHIINFFATRKCII